MKRVSISIDDGLAAVLDGVALPRTPARAAFLRAAIRRALMEHGELAIEAGYVRVPDNGPEYFDPGAWEDARTR